MGGPSENANSDNSKSNTNNKITSAPDTSKGAAGGGGGTEGSNSDLVFDEPDDELEEFDEVGSTDKPVDIEVAKWEEDWDANGWDDDDINDEFINQLHTELEAFKARVANNSNNNTAVAK